MAVLATAVERDSDVFSRRRGRMESLVAELRERTALVAQGGGEKALERHRSRNKLTARERIDRLCDPDTAFLELSALARRQSHIQRRSEMPEGAHVGTWVSASKKWSR